MFRNLFLVMVLVFCVHNSAYAELCSARNHLKNIREQLGDKCNHSKNRFNCLDVIKVTDGDTIAINIPGVHSYFGRDTYIRLSGLDTPEKRPPSVKCIPTTSADSRLDQFEYLKCLEAERLRQCEVNAAIEATEILQKTVCQDSDRVDVELAVDSQGNLYREKYGRVLGNVFVTSSHFARQEVIDVKNLLLKSKLAFKYDGGPRANRNWCDKTIITDKKLKKEYIRKHFCSSRKCTERVIQTRCFNRSDYSVQKDCYVDRIEKNIKSWFRFCLNKTDQERRNCFLDKALNYLDFCRQYDSRMKSRMCRADLKIPIEIYCKTLDPDALEDCLLAL